MGWGMKHHRVELDAIIWNGTGFGGMGIFRMKRWDGLDGLE